MEKREEKQLVPSPDMQKEQEEGELLPLEVLDVPVNQLLKLYKSREIPRRWKVEVDGSVTKHKPRQANNNRNTIQSTQSAESLRGDPICHRCDKPMKLFSRSNKTGTRQVWFCPECFLYRIRLAEYTVAPG